MGAPAIEPDTSRTSTQGQRGSGLDASSTTAFPNGTCSAMGESHKKSFDHGCVYNKTEYNKAAA
jgi:hypothetical protein